MSSDPEDSKLLIEKRECTEDERKLVYIKYLFGTGHVMNDLCAASWFSYMLVYFEKVAVLSSASAGGLVLLGQIVDGLTTPLVGIGCDSSASKADPGVPGDTVARRIPWHLAGSLLVAVSYPWLFIEDAQYTFGRSDLAVFFWYAIYVTLFQMGWATTQITHLSLIPDLSAGRESRRTALNATRYAATVLSTVTVYSVAWALLNSARDDEDVTPFDSPVEDLLEGSNSNDPNNNLNRSNHTQFRALALFITSLGVLLSLVTFHCGMRYTTRNAGHLLVDPESPKAGQGASTKDTAMMWLRTKKFYFVGGMYMCTRLLVNITQTYLALYLLESLDMSRTSIASTPLVLYASSLVGTIVIGPLVKKIGASYSYLMATFGCTIAGFILYFVPTSQTWMTYPAAALFGTASSLLMVSCLSVVAELIGDRPGSAFVYGAFSFTDKFSSGIVIMLIQTIDLGVSQAKYYRLVVGIFPALVGLLAVAMIALCMSMPPPPAWDDHIAAKSCKKESAFEEAGNYGTNSSAIN